MTTGHREDGGVELDTYSPHPSQYAYGLGPNSAEDSKGNVLEFDANYDDHNRFEVPELGKPVEAFSVPLGGGPLYLPIHKLCYQLAERFIRSKAESRDISLVPSKDEIFSTEQLWEILYRRLPGSPFSSEYILPDPYEYYGGRGCRNVYWEPDDDPDDGQLLEADPVEIPRLTEFILENLQSPVPEKAKGTMTEANSEPQHIHQSSDIAHSQYWCDTLADKKGFPWLWDLDAELVRKKQEDGDWGWELLVHKLSQVKMHQASDATLNLPLGLRNRRRIWRCLEDARIDDVAREMRTPRWQTQKEA
ncbi:hypothetical protein NUW58_g1448 [Xylaria curta]|uniref:Uncharacterized protein n=1 Tax=Xylaria curta TaxID=42375 RepID=A0ACC1PLZ9_9PEZI|nr:hypothetical protein NUW58_g1448 [Xylaria curta]